jgi:hypothetical protein
LIIKFDKPPTRPTNEINLFHYEYQIASDDLTKWIDELEKYECRNCPVGYSRIDSNNLRSFSCLQFQLPTFKQYYKKYYPESVKNMEEEDWLNQIYDCDMQKELTYKMLNDKWGNWTHWKYSILVRGLEKPPKN